MKFPVKCLKVLKLLGACIMVHCPVYFKPAWCIVLCFNSYLRSKNLKSSAGLCQVQRTPLHLSIRWGSLALMRLLPNPNTGTFVLSWRRSRSPMEKLCPANGWVSTRTEDEFMVNVMCHVRWLYLLKLWKMWIIIWPLCILSHLSLTNSSIANVLWSLLFVSIDLWEEALADQELWCLVALWLS